VVEDVFAVQDEITTAVVTAVLPAISDTELHRILRKQPESLGAWEAYQRGLWQIAKRTASDNEKAITFLQNVIELDVTLSSACVPLVEAYYDSGQFFAVRPFEEALRLAGVWAHKAAEIDPNDAEVQACLGAVAHLSGRLEAAWDYASQALAINPHSTRENAFQGALLIFDGRPAEGRNVTLAAMRLDPRDPCQGHHLTQIAVSYYLSIGTLALWRPPSA
jgi:adenylate cyclase